MLQSGNYGVQWTARKRDDDPSTFGRVVVIVVIVALVSLACTIVKRLRADKESFEETREQTAAEEVRLAPILAEERAQELAKEAEKDPPPPPPSEVPRLEKRPPKVRNLLMRLEEAERRHDIEMAITTIEALRALPGSPAADLDNNLARRLGVLNIRRLFVLKSQLWVTTVEVKRGDAASRIASEHGSTLASLIKLNGRDVDKIKAGEKLVVLNHPRFNLVIKRRSRIADLNLNGKFFKRYDLETTEGLFDGAFEWREMSSLQMRPEDKSELDMLLPKTTSVLISET